MKQLNFLTVVFLISFNHNLRGQEAPLDSVKRNDSTQKVVTLDAIDICENAGNTENALNFHKHSKLATTDDILSKINGVSLIKRGAYGMEPVLRSFSANQINITLDGMRIYGACTDKMDPVSIYVEPINVGAIDITHGSKGALNGSTIGGQIDFRLKEASFTKLKKTGGQVTQGYASNNNGLSSSFAVQKSDSTKAWRIDGVYRKAGLYEAGDGVSVKYSGYEKLNLRTVLLLKTQNRGVIKINYLFDLGRNIGYPALPMDVGKAFAHVAGVSHVKEFRPSKTFSKNEVKLYYNEITHYMDDTKRPDAPMHMDMPGWTRTLGFYNELFSKDRLRIRLDVHHVYSRADMVMYPKDEAIMYMQTLPENRLLNGGLAMQYVKQFRQNQTLKFNTRIDYFLQSATEGAGSLQWRVFDLDVVEPRSNLLKNIGINYTKKLLKYSEFSLNAGYGERLPTANERYGFYLFNRQDMFDYVGNIDLKPEQSKQLEVKYSYNAKTTALSADVFYNCIENYIYSYKVENAGQMTIGARGLKTYKNIRSAYNAGFEASVKFVVYEKLTSLTNLKYTYAKTYDEKPLPLIPPLKIQEVLRYNVKLFQFQAEFDYVAAQTKINEDFYEYATPSFYLINLRVSKNIKCKYGILQISTACENLLDASYREHLDIGLIPRMGRNFVANVGFLF